MPGFRWCVLLFVLCSKCWLRWGWGWRGSRGGEEREGWMHHALFRFVAAAARQGRFGCGPRHRSSDSVIRIMIFVGGNSVQRMGRPAQCGRSRVWRSNVRACCEFGHPDAEHAERGAEHAEKITPNRRKPLLWALCAPLCVLCVKGGITSERRRRQFGIRSGSFADLRDSNSWDPPLRRPLPCRAGQSGERRGGKLFPSCHDRPALTRVLVRPTMTQGRKPSSDCPACRAVRTKRYLQLARIENCCIGLPGLDLGVPDHSTLSHRPRRWACRHSGEPEPARRICLKTARA
jgi:hypothetical protein